jgi:TolB-like protein
VLRQRAHQATVPGLLALACLAGCCPPPAREAHSTYFRWLETIPSRFLAVSVRSAPTDAAAFEQAVRERFATPHWFREIGREPRVGGYHLELDCQCWTGGGGLCAHADVAWVLSWVAGGNPGGRVCVASGSVAETAEQAFSRDARWLREQAFRRVVDRILRTLAEQRPVDPHEAVLRRASTGKTVAELRFALCGGAFERGLGMAYPRVSNALAESGWVKVVARSDLETLLKELRLGETELVEEAKRLKEALKGADILLVGTVSEHAGCEEIDVRLVDVSTGAVLRACHGGCYRRDQLPWTCNRLVNRLTARGLDPGSGRPRIAVTLVRDNSPRAEKRGLAACFAPALTTALAERTDLCVLERPLLESVLKEKRLRETELVAADALKLGKLYQADYLVTGEVGDESISISVISVHDGGARLAFDDGGATVEFLVDRSFWHPATQLAERVAQAIRLHARSQTKEETR